MIFNILNDIDSETVNLFTAFLNDAESDPNKKPYIEIFLNSNGGEPAHGNIILYMINERKERVTLTAHNQIFSTAFELYVLAQCDKKILPYTTAMYHRATQEITMTSGNTPKTATDTANLNSLIADEAVTKKVCELTKMSEEEKADIFNDKDVYFSYERLLEIL